jgi:hypothetical protein
MVAPYTRPAGELRRAPRTGSQVEYLVIVLVVALGAQVAWRAFGSAIQQVLHPGAVPSARLDVEGVGACVGGLCTAPVASPPASTAPAGAKEGAPPAASVPVPAKVDEAADEAESDQTAASPGPEAGGGRGGLLGPLTPAVGATMFDEARRRLKDVSPSGRAAAAEVLVGDIEANHTGGEWHAVRLPASRGARAWTTDRATLVIDSGGAMFSGANTEVRFGVVEGRAGVVDWSRLAQVR